MSLAYQLSQQFPEYGQKLSTLHLESEQGKDAPTLFDNLIGRPLQGADIPIPSQPQLVVIDALDEATRDGRNELVEFIATYWSHTPPWLKLIITSRPESAVTSRLHQPELQPFVLDAFRAEHLVDLRKYLLAGLVKLGLSASTSIVEEIIKRSEGVFLYITTLLEELQYQRLSLNHVDEFPRGMAGHYQRFFTRQFPQFIGYESGPLPVLKAIVAQRGPLPLDLLAIATHLTDVGLRTRLSALGSLFPIRKGEHSGDMDTVSPFHKSIVDWLTGIDMTTRLPTAGAFAVDRDVGDQLLTEAVWSEYLHSPGAWSSYVLRHLPAHLCSVGRWKDAVEALTDLDYLGARVQAGQVFELVLDIDAAQHSLPDELLRQRLLPWSHFLRSSASFFGEHTAAFFQQAYNEPGLSPVSLAAQQRWALDCKDRGEIKSSSAQVMPRAFLEWLNRPTDWFLPACRLTLAGHKGKTTSVALSADGSTVVSGSYDETVKVWDVRTGECRLNLAGHAAGVASVALSDDGMTIVSGSFDETVKVWDARTGDCRFTLVGHRGAVAGVALSGDGATVVSGCYGDETVKVWDVGTGECRLTLAGHAGGVTSVGLSGDGTTVISGSGDETVKVWDVGTGECRQTLVGHSGGISSIALSPDGRTIVSGAYDETAKVWDARTGCCTVTLAGHMGVVSSVSLSGDRSTIVSGAWDKSVKVWDARTGVCNATLSGHAELVTSVAVSEDGSTVVSGSGDKSVKVWHARAGACHSTLPGHARRVTSIAVSRDGSMVVSGSLDKTVKLWSAKLASCERTLIGHTGGVTSVALSEDGSTVASGAYDETVKVWDVRTGACRWTFAGHSGGVICVAWSRDGSTIVSGSYDETAKVWDARTRECRSALVGHSGGVTCVALSRDGSIVVSGSGDQSAKVWQAQTGTCRMTLIGHTGGVTSVALSGDGSTIVSGSGDETLRVWDASTGICRATLKGHAGIVLSVGISENGLTAVSGAWDQMVKVWDTQTGVCCATYPESATEAAAAWRSVGVIKEAFQLASLAGSLYIPISEGSPPLVTFGPYDKGVGTLSDDRILAFNSRGEAFWFQIRHRLPTVIPTHR